MSWINLTNLEQLEEIKSSETNNLILLFKYSTRCGVNRIVLSRFEKSTNFNSKNVAFYYLDLVKYNNLSNAIATQFNITHQSPQLLVIKRGKVIAHYSHHNIIFSFNLKNYV